MSSKNDAKIENDELKQKSSLSGNRHLWSSDCCLILQ